MNALSPARAEVTLLSRTPSPLVAILTARRSSYDALFMFAVQLDRTLASRPDDDARDKLERVAAALDCEIEEGPCFSNAVRAKMLTALDRFRGMYGIQSDRSPDALEYMTVCERVYVEDAADEIVADLRTLMAGWAP